jgi:hypothetical protein
MPLIEFKRAGQGEREGEDQENVGLLDLAIDRVCIYVHGFPKFRSLSISGKPDNPQTANGKKNSNSLKYCHTATTDLSHTGNNARTHRSHSST